MDSIPLSLRLAIRELRGGLKGFRIFITALTLGVFTITGVGSLSEALIEGLRQDGRKLLGGDVELRLTHRPIMNNQLAFLKSYGNVSTVIEMRAMAVSTTDNTARLVELKGFDKSYPLFGKVKLLGTKLQLSEFLEDSKDQIPIAFAEPILLEGLRKELGDKIKIGAQIYKIAGIIKNEPDRAADLFVIGPRLMVDINTLSKTGLIQEGSLIRYRYRLDLFDEHKLDYFIDQLETKYPNAGWRIRDVRDGAPGLKRLIRRMQQFLTLVGVTSLLLGGIGISNAVRSYLEKQNGSIATLKCLGASNPTIFRCYLIQIIILSSIGIIFGLLIGCTIPFFVAGLVREYIPVHAHPSIYPEPMLWAAAFGYLTAIGFSILPLGQLKSIPGQALFRYTISPQRSWPQPRYIIYVIITGLCLALGAVLSTEEQRFTIWYVIGVTTVLIFFVAISCMTVALFARLRHPKTFILRLAVANIHRPGSATIPTLISFGLGLTAIVTITLIQGNLSMQLNQNLPATAPAFFFIDIQPHQAESFEKLATSIPGVSEVTKVPALRGRITKINGIDSSKIQIDPAVAWVLRGDRGLTYMKTPPADLKIVAGEWWDPNYSGQPIVSLDAVAAEGMNISIGDNITINVLGRSITAKIVNLRHVNWSSMGINFVVIFGPGVLENAPHSYIATAITTPEAETPLQNLITSSFANITSIRVRDILKQVHSIASKIGSATQAAAGITLIAGILVLGGAIASGQRNRVHDSVVLKVLGATRYHLVYSHLIEYLFLGLISGSLALIVGHLTAYAVITELMQGTWIWMPSLALIILAISLPITIVIGLGATLAALSQRVAYHLRNH